MSWLDEVAKPKGAAVQEGGGNAAPFSNDGLGTEDVPVPPGHDDMRPTPRNVLVGAAADLLGVSFSIVCVLCCWFILFHPPRLMYRQ